jgi:hypothetical protein
MNTQQQQQQKEEEQSQLRQRKQPLTSESPTSLLPQETQEEEDSKKSQRTLVSTPSPLRQGSLVVALTLTLLSLFTRLYRIADADFVVWYVYLSVHLILDFLKEIQMKIMTEHQIGTRLILASLPPFT